MTFFYKNLANIISSLRIIFLPLLVYLALRNLREEFVFASVVLILTDIIDGFVARLLKIKSSKGRLVDTIADGVFYPVLYFLTVYIIREEIQRYFLWFIAPVIFFLVPKLIIVYYFKKWPTAHIRSWQISTYFGMAFLIVSVLTKFNALLLFLTNFMYLLGSIEETLFYLLQKDNLDEEKNSLFEVLRKKKV